VSSPSKASGAADFAKRRMPRDVSADSAGLVTSKMVAEGSTCYSSFLFDLRVLRLIGVPKVDICHLGAVTS
jgi:hypothetical protein